MGHAGSCRTDGVAGFDKGRWPVPLLANRAGFSPAPVSPIWAIARVPLSNPDDDDEGQIAYTPTNSSWLNHIEAQFTALRYFALDGTGHATHKEQASMIRRYIIWRNNPAYDERLRRIVDRANVA